MANLSRSEAVQIVTNAFEDIGYTHPRLLEACLLTGTSPAELRRLRGAVKQVTRGRGRLELPTPTGCGRRQ